MRRVSFAASVLLLICPWAGLSQGSILTSVEGRVECAHLSDGLSVEARPLGEAPAVRALVDRDGTFTLLDIAEGEYILVLIDESGDPIYEMSVNIGDTRMIVMKLDDEQSKGAPSAGSVSIRTLAHPPAKKALKAAQTALRLSAAGEHEKAIVELRKAVALSPDYADARNNLGVQYLLLKRYSEAAAELESSINIAPSGRAYCNLSVAYSFLGRSRDAEIAARQSVTLDPANSKTHLRLGSVLADRPEARDEAIRELGIAAPANPSAYKILVHLYLIAGQPAAAEDALKHIEAGAHN